MADRSTAFLEGNDRGGAEEALAAIADDLTAVDPGRVGSGSYFDGAAGIALAFQALSQVPATPRSRRTIYVAKHDEWLARAASLVTPPSRPVESARFDLLAGAAGVGLNALRAPSPASTQLATEAVCVLESLAVTDSEGTAWPTRRSEDGRQEGDIDLGMAHGVAGVISFLSRAVACGVETKRASALLDGALRRMTRTRPGPFPCRFPAIVSAVSPSSWSRAAWCYGDPGVACALMHAATATGRADARTLAYETLRRAALRSHDRDGVIDAGFCHGAFGVAHILHRAFQAFGGGTFAKGARRALHRGLSFREPGRGIGGFTSLQGHHVVSDPSLLHGAAGIALVLADALYGVATDWDHLLGTSTAAFAPLRGAPKDSAAHRGTRSIVPTLRPPPGEHDRAGVAARVS